MTDRRSGPPLFDLMRDRGDRPDPPRPQQPQQPKQPSAQPNPQPAASTQAPAKPIPQPVRSETRQTAWDSTGGVSRAERSAAAMLDEPAPRDTGISLSTTKFYSLIAIALVLIVGAWAGGYKIGFGDGKDSMSQFIQDEPVVTPPANNQQVSEPTNSGSGSGASDTPASTQRPQPQNSTTSQPGNPQLSGTIMSPTGYRAQDPRTEGMNYLVLATLPTEQAADAIQFMQANGLTVIGVPVLDSRASSANNPSRYTLYSLGLAIPGNRWSAMSNQRLEHQQVVARLGAQWQRERRGGSDFSQTNWEKYEP